MLGLPSEDLLTGRRSPVVQGGGAVGVAGPGGGVGPLGLQRAVEPFGLAEAPMVVKSSGVWPRLVW